LVSKRDTNFLPQTGEDHALPLEIEPRLKIMLCLTARPGVDCFREVLENDCESLSLVTLESPSKLSQIQFGEALPWIAVRPPSRRLPQEANFNSIAFTYAISHSETECRIAQLSRERDADAQISEQRDCWRLWFGRINQTAISGNTIAQTRDAISGSPDLVNSASEKTGSDESTTTSETA
jgi:hypothetical protein